QEREHEKRVRPAAMIPEVVEARREEEKVEVRDDGRETADEEREARLGLVRRRAGQHGPREGVRHRVHEGPDDTVRKGAKERCRTSRCATKSSSSPAALRAWAVRSRSLSEKPAPRSSSSRGARRSSGKSWRRSPPREARPRTT